MNDGVLYLVRHAETEMNQKNQFRGHANPALTVQGRAEARVLKAKLAGKFDKVVTDSYLRTRETAAIIAPNYELETDDGLKGWDTGSLSGQPKKGTERIFNKMYVEHPDQPIPEGESLNAYLRRFRAAYEYWLSRAIKGERILLVTHGSGLGAVLHNFGVLPYEDGVVPPPSSIVRVLPGSQPELLPS